MGRKRMLIRRKRSRKSGRGSTGEGMRRPKKMNLGGGVEMRQFSSTPKNVMKNCDIALLAYHVCNEVIEVGQKRFSFC